MRYLSLAHTPIPLEILPRKALHNACCTCIHVQVTTYMYIIYKLLLKLKQCYK